jgi:hypothetical protein
MLKDGAANRKIMLSALPNVSPYISSSSLARQPLMGPGLLMTYMTLKFLALQGAPCIYDFSRVKGTY